MQFCAPLTPDPGDATGPKLRMLVLALWALTEQYYKETKYAKRLTFFVFLVFIPLQFLFIDCEQNVVCSNTGFARNYILP